MVTAWIVDCKNDKTSNVQIELVDNSPFHLKGSFKGPEDTPYQGGHFDVVSSHLGNVHSGTLSPPQDD